MEFRYYNQPIRKCYACPNLVKYVFCDGAEVRHQCSALNYKEIINCEIIPKSCPLPFMPNLEEALTKIFDHYAMSFEVDGRYSPKPYVEEVQKLFAAYISTTMPKEDGK